MKCLKFGRFDGVGVFVEAACEVAAAFGDGDEFLGSELAWFVVFYLSRSSLIFSSISWILSFYIMLPKTNRGLPLFYR